MAPGAGIVGYALYDFVDFSSSLANSGTVFAEAQARLNNVSDWAAVDCSISSLQDAQLFGYSTCDCFVDATARLWRCTARASLGVTQDCNIDMSSWCTCSQTMASTQALVWTCSVDNIASYIAPNATAVDLGLRFLPPGMANELSALPYFRNVRATVNDSFYLLFAEPIPDVTPILNVLLASLCVDLIGLVVMVGAIVVDILVRRGVVSDEWDKIDVRGRRVRVMMAVELLLLTVGMILFGVTLVVAFTNPLFNKPEAKVQQVETRNAVARLRDNLPATASGAPTTVSRACKCPQEFASRCTSMGNMLEFARATTWNVSNVVFECSVTVRGDCTVSAPATVMGDMRVLGNAVINAALLVEGRMAVVGGDASGTSWNTPQAVTVGGDLSITHGALVVNSSLDARLDGVRGRVLIADGALAYAGAALYVSISDPTDARSRLHTSAPLQLPVALTLTVWSQYPRVVFQPSMSVTAASSDTSTAVRVANASLAVGLAWSFMESMATNGVCGSMSATAAVAASHVTVTFRVNCVGTPPVIGASDAASATQLALVSVTQSYPVMTPDGLELRFAFNRTNCGTVLSYRRERDWLFTLDQAGFSTLYTICPRALMEFDETALCIRYVCNGTFALPDRFGVAQQNAITANVLQGVVFDAVATSLDLLGVVLEYVVLALVVTAALAAASGAIPMRTTNHNPQFQAGQ